MSIKFSSFDSMTRQNKINALMNIKNTGSVNRADYFLTLHAMLDEDIQICMSAKMALTNFVSQNWYQDFGKPSDPLTKPKIADFLRQNIGFGPEIFELENSPERQQMAQNLAKKQKKFETLQEWDGPFPQSARLLNTLREDTQQILLKLLDPAENYEKCWICLFNETLQPFKDCHRSLDSNAATMVVNLSRIQNPAQIDPTLGTMFGQTERPAYLLALATGKRCLLLLRDETGTSQASVLAFSLQNIVSIRNVKDGANYSIEIETQQDFIKLPMMAPEDADEAVAFLREKSIESIEAQEEFIDRDFDKELKKLDMLFKARAIQNSEYIFRKSRLQKMELEKFSDANIELLLAKRFSDGSQGEKFDEQLLKKFTFEKTVMFTDIVGFSSKASQKMLLDTMTLLAVHDKLLMPLIKQYDGTLIKKIGDALMVRFDEPLKACNAAREMQTRLFEFNKKHDEKIFIRIGINTGTVFVKNDDVFGDAVNMAARMEALAKPGRIFITETTMKCLENKLPAENIGAQQVKGREKPIIVYSLIDSTNQANEMAEMANELMQTTGIQPAVSENPPTQATESFANEKSVQLKTIKAAQVSDIVDMPASAVMATPEEYPASLLYAIDYARQSYIEAVKEGRQRNPELEDWFARFEALLRQTL